MAGVFPSPIDAEPRLVGSTDDSELVAAIGAATGLVATMEALVASDRRVDVTGLEGEVGLLCARALDLPPERARLVRHELMRLGAQVDRLNAALREHAG